ncbi:MAG: adaptor protein MecA [Oscillospiraceae bacterium]|jgi:negative regulator of genetic competence, sporulation and motility|nr:adaptor protein MecA [Oscillospiraceae bacterium]
MEIILISADKLKVTLDKQDVKSLSVNLKSPDCASEKNREFFLGLLEKGKRETGFSPKGAKVFIEVYPGGEGGCVICFTAFDKSQYPRKLSKLQPVIFSFDDADTLCEGAVRLFERYSHRIYKSALHHYRGAFVLTIYPLDFSDRLSVYFLSEYAQRLGEGDILAAYVDEHGCEIIPEGALDTLNDYFGGTF